MLTFTTLLLLSHQTFYDIFLTHLDLFFCHCLGALNACDIGEVVEFDDNT